MCISDVPEHEVELHRIHAGSLRLRHSHRLLVHLFCYHLLHRTNDHENGGNGEIGMIFDGLIFFDIYSDIVSVLLRLITQNCFSTFCAVLFLFRKIDYFLLNR